MITKNTSVIGIFGGTEYDLYKLFEGYGPKDSDFKRAKRIAKYYIKYGKLFILRADLAWCQMVHETGWLRFKGAAKPEWNNFAGIGVTGPANIGNRFKTEELGIIAQFAHLAWYVTPTHINSYCSIKYDPRHFGHSHRYNGNSSLDRLAGSWAVPGRYKQKDGTWITYGGQIAKFANLIFPSEEAQSFKEKIIEKVVNAIHLPTSYNWQYLAFHHTVSGQFWTTMEMIKRWHLARKPPFLREGYNFGVNGNGEIEIGRPLTMQGAHVKYYNRVAIGVAIYGDFRTDKITSKQKKAVFELSKGLIDKFSIPLDNILGHKEFGANTSCPCINMGFFRKEFGDYVNKEMEGKK